MTTSNALTRSLATSSRRSCVHDVHVAHLAATQQRQRQRGLDRGRASNPHLLEDGSVAGDTGEQRLDDFGEELVHLLRRTTDEAARLHRAIELVARDAERIVRGDAIEQVVVSPRRP